MRLSVHAKAKLEIYGIAEKDVISASQKPQDEFYDSVEDTYIIIIEIGNVLLAVILSKKKDVVITIYPTEAKTIINRKKAGRWI